MFGDNYLFGIALFGIRAVAGVIRDLEGIPKAVATEAVGCSAINGAGFAFNDLVAFKRLEGFA